MTTEPGKPLLTPEEASIMEAIVGAYAPLFDDPKPEPSEMEKLIAETKAFSELIEANKTDWIDRLHQVEQDLNDHACELPEGWRDMAIDNLDTALSSVSYAAALIEKLDTAAIDEIHETLKGAKEDADHMYEVSESRFGDGT